MKQTQVAKLRKYVDKHPIFTIKDVQKLTQANNCYSIIHDLRKEEYIDSSLVKNKKGIRFQVYFTYQVFYFDKMRYLRRHNLELA